MDRDLEKILQDCITAKAFIGRIEQRLVSYAHSRQRRIASDAQNRPSDAFESERRAITRLEDENATDAVLDAKSSKSSLVTQTDLFGNDSVLADNSVKTRKKQKKYVKRGCPTLTRGQCLSALRRISGEKKFLNVEDVNEIFGYSRTTSGTFVRHAWKRGELVGIPCGSGFVFLASDVRSFINIHFDRMCEAEKGDGK